MPKGSGNLGAAPLLMSGESACPIIEAMLRAQIAETRDRRGRRETTESKLETQPAKNFSSARVLETCRKVRAFLALQAARFYLYTLEVPHHRNFLFLIVFNCLRGSMPKRASIRRARIDDTYVPATRMRNLYVST